MGNAYMDKQRQMQQYYFEAGEEVGFQRCLDYMQTLLRNPRFVGKDTFGRKRWEKLYEGLKECDKTFGDAFVFDNQKLLDNDPNYLAKLASLPDAERKALLYGDWDSFSGQYFTDRRSWMPTSGRSSGMIPCRSLRDIPGSRE